MQVVQGNCFDVVLPRSGGLETSGLKNFYKFERLQYIIPEIDRKKADWIFTIDYRGRYASNDEKLY